MRGRFAALGLFVLACGGGDGGRETTVAYTSTPMLGTDDDGGDDDDDGVTGEVFDLGADADTSVLPTQGCSGIDFLFVIDNSSSMAAQQERLLASFGGFITAIQNTIQDVTSYHVGVITSDAYAFNAPGCQGLGDLVTQTGGMDSAGSTCGPFAGGQRFATDLDDLNGAFPCLARVGTEGSAVELPVTAAVASVQPEGQAAGACNAGFLRDDAILVLVFVTDDPPYVGDLDDAHPDAVTTGWHDAIVAAKHGDEAASVVIGFIPWQDLSCLVYELDSPNLIAFVESFGERGVLASVCSPDYTTIFASTVATIQETCQEFTPAG